MISTFRASLLLLLCLHGVATANLPIPQPPSLSSQAYILLDAQTGTVLAQSGADERYEPASLTKIMTTYLVFQALRDGVIGEQDLVPISLRARQAVGSRMFVEVNSEVPLMELLRGVIVQSGNDASIALAEHIAGTEEAFSSMMNQEANRLGLTQSHFTDSSGLGGKDHYMSARDIAELSRVLIREYPEYYRMFKELDYTWNNIKQPNRNRLLWLDDAVDGIKTGYTSTAKYCLAASAYREDLGGMRLISVVLGAEDRPTRVRDTRALLKWGFRFFRTEVTHAGMDPRTKAQVWYSDERVVPIGIAQDHVMTFPLNIREELKDTWVLHTELHAPVQQGQEVGILEISHQGNILATIPAIALQDIEEGSFFTLLKDYFALLTR